MRIDTSSVFNSIKDIHNAGCSPTFEGLVVSFRNKSHETTTTSNKRQATASANTGPQIKSFIAHNFADEDYFDDTAVEDSGLGALEVPRDTPEDSPAATALDIADTVVHEASYAIKSSSDMLRSILSPPSAATISSLSSTFHELKEEAFSSTASRTASPSATFSPSFRGRRSKESASSSATTRRASPPTPRATKKTLAAAARATRTLDKEKSEGQSLLSRSQARRMKLQQSYNEIMKNTSPTSIKEQHEQYQQLLQQQQQEGRDDETSNSRRSDMYADIKSPRVRKLYDFDFREDDQDGNNNNGEEQEVEEYTPTHRSTNDADDWEDSAELRRGHRISAQKSALDLTEIEQFTKDVRERMQRCSPKVDGYNDNDDNDDEIENENNKTSKKLQKLVKEFEEEWKREPKKTSNNFKRQSCSDIEKKKKETMTASSSINDDTTVAAATVATRWKALQTKPQDHEIALLSEKEIPDDKLEAWWKERQQSAKKSFSASERFDMWWKSQKESKNKELGGGWVGGSTTTMFQELEGEPTVEADVASKKKVSFAIPSKKDIDATCTTSMSQASSKRDGREEPNKEQHDDSQSSVVEGSNTVNHTQQASSSTATAASALLSNEDEDLSSHSQFVANDVASGTLKVVLSRVDEAKEQFVKALEDNDVMRQSELAALLARLGEAAAAMRKLGQM